MADSLVVWKPNRFTLCAVPADSSLNRENCVCAGPIIFLAAQLHNQPVDSSDSSDTHPTAIKKTRGTNGASPAVKQIECRLRPRAQSIQFGVVKSTILS